MAGIKDLYESAAGAVSKGFEIAKEKSADAYNRIRGANVAPAASGTVDASAEARAASAEKAYTDKVNQFNQRAAARPAAAPQPAPAAGGVQPPRPGWAGPQPLTGPGSAAGANPNVGPGRPSVEAQAYQAQPKGAFPQQATGGLRGMARIAGPAAVAGLEGYDLAKAAADPASTGTDITRQVGRGAIRGGMTLLGGAGGAALGSLVPGPGTIIGGAAGGAAGYALGDKVSDFVFGPQGPAATQQKPMINPLIEGEFAAQPPQDTSMIPTNRGLRTPEALIAGTEVPDRGYGAFKRTTPGNEGEAQKIGDGTVPSAAPAQKAGFRTPAIMAGYNAKVANFKAAQARESGAAREANLGIKAATLGLQIGEKNRNNIANRVSAEAGRDKDILALDPKDRKDAIQQRKDELTARIETSFSRRSDGVTLENATPKHIDQALIGDKFRKAVEKGRGDKAQWAVDFIGDNRHDSDNVFSYLPVYKEGTRVYTANGNSMAGNRAQGREAGFNFFGPNDPVDADMQRYLRNLPTKEEYEASLAKAKKGK